MVSVLNVECGLEKKTDIHRTYSLYTWGHLQSRQFQRHQVHHRLLLSLLLRASMISMLDESRSQKRSRPNLNLLRFGGSMSSRTEASTKQVSNRKPRNHTAKAAVDQFHAPVDLGDGLSKTQSLQEQQLLCLASNVLLFENLLQPQYDATCLRHACDMPAMLHHPYQKGFNTERKERPGLHTTKEIIHVHRPLYRNNVANRQARPGLWSQ